MGFKQSKADPDLWIRDQQDHYEYICVFVDDIIAFSKKPEELIEPLTKTFGY